MAFLLTKAFDISGRDIERFFFRKKEGICETKVCYSGFFW